jgi:hypothetical protein
MTSPFPPIRRIVTGIDAQGHSCIVQDGSSPAVFQPPERPGFRVTNLWRTVGSPVDVNAVDSIAQHHGVSPPAGGTVVRIIDIPPEPSDPEERRRAIEEAFKKLFPDADHRPNDARHPGMHVTDTVDYAIVLEGELVAILDRDETTMRAGDVLIQRGTNHAWANRSGKNARILFVLVAGKR